MKLEKFAQSGFIIETDAGARVAFDIGSYEPLENLAKEHPVNSFLVSHIHPDHFSLERINALLPEKLFVGSQCRQSISEADLNCDITKIEVGQALEVADDVYVEFFNVDHGPNISAPLCENFGFVITSDGKTIYFAGDMFYPSGIDVASRDFDYTLMPVGTYYTFGPQEAFKFIKTFKNPGTIVPMHYHHHPETRDEFIALTSKSFRTQVM